jgi:hypothetical protein
MSADLTDCPTDQPHSGASKAPPAAKTSSMPTLTAIVVADCSDWSSRCHLNRARPRTDLFGTGAARSTDVPARNRRSRPVASPSIEVRDKGEEAAWRTLPAEGDGRRVIGESERPTKPFLILLVLAGAQLTVILDATIVRVALRAIGRDLAFTQSGRR